MRYLIYNILYDSYFEQFYHGHAEWNPCAKTARTFSEERAQQLASQLMYVDIIPVETVSEA